MYLRGSHGYATRRALRPPSLLVPRPATLLRPLGLAAFLPVHAEGTSGGCGEGAPPGAHPPAHVGGEPPRCASAGTDHERTLPALTDAAAAKRPRMETDARKRAIKLLVEIAVEYFHTSPLLATIVDEEGAITEASPSIDTMLAVKSAGTLSKTCGFVEALL